MAVCTTGKGEARHFGDEQVLARTQELVREEMARVYPELRQFRKDLAGKRAAVYVGGAFKCFSLVKALRLLEMKTVLVGSQTGNRADYEELQRLCDPGTVMSPVWNLVPRRCSPSPHRGRSGSLDCGKTPATC